MVLISIIHLKYNNNYEVLFQLMNKNYHKWQSANTKLKCYSYYHLYVFGMFFNKY